MRRHSRIGPLFGQPGQVCYGPNLNAARRCCRPAMGKVLVERNAADMWFTGPGAASPYAA